jgi:hypothetical protein
MWVKGHYEYKVEFQNRLVLEREGIYPDYYMVRYKGQDFFQDKFLASERSWDNHGTLIDNNQEKLGDSQNI